MAEAHKVVLHNNQTSIEKLSKDKFSNRKERSIDTILLAVDRRLDIDAIYDYDDDDEEIEEEKVRLPLLYFRWIYNMLHEIESHFLNDDSNKIVGIYLFGYSDDLTGQTLEKFTSASASLANFLPPSILCAPQEDYLSSLPHFTIKSNPVYIVKTGN
jgi:hypothetical protein